MSLSPPARAVLSDPSNIAFDEALYPGLVEESMDIELAELKEAELAVDDAEEEELWMLTLAAQMRHVQVGRRGARRGWGGVEGWVGAVGWGGGGWGGVGWGADAPCAGAAEGRRGWGMCGGWRGGGTCAIEQIRSAPAPCGC